MAISRAQLLKELLPGLNALFGLEYKTYAPEHSEIYETESSERSFEEETKLSGFSAAPVKKEGSGHCVRQCTGSLDGSLQPRDHRDGFRHHRRGDGRQPVRLAGSPVHQGPGSGDGVHEAGQGGFAPQQRVHVRYGRRRQVPLRGGSPAGLRWRQQQHVLALRLT